MRGANMNVVGRAVVKCFATGVTGERVFSDAFFVRFQVAIEDRLVSKPTSVSAIKPIATFIT